MTTTEIIADTLKLETGRICVLTVAGNGFTCQSIGKLTQKDSINYFFIKDCCFRVDAVKTIYVDE